MCAKACAIVVISVTTGLLWGAGEMQPLAAQQGPSLANVAKQEEARRKNIKAPSKVIKNDDLAPAPVVSRPTTSDAATPDASTDATNAPAPADGEKKGTEQVKDQAYWSKRYTELQGSVSRNETFAVALQSRINALANEYTNQGDGVQQRAIAAERQKAIDDLNRLNKEIADGKKALADFQEEARQAGVPAGWLR
jgi:hypothetical protein